MGTIVDVKGIGYVLHIEQVTVAVEKTVERVKLHDRENFDTKIDPKYVDVDRVRDVEQSREIYRQTINDVDLSVSEIALLLNQYVQEKMKKRGGVNNANS